MRRQRRSNSGNALMIRLVIGLIIAGFSLFSFLTSQQYNEVTGENQYVSLTPQQEIALGLQSVPELVDQFGGMYPDDEVQREIDNIGWDLVNNSVAADTPWEWEFYVLDDPETINAFALPGGQVFITTAMLSKLETTDEVAGVLSHEIVHVLARHSAQRIAQSELTNGLVGAVAVASGEADAARTAAMVAQLVNMRYGREAELESDTLGVCIMLDAGYEPEAMVEVMRVLEAAGGGRQPEFFSTHPNPGNRIEQIEERIANADSECR